jgi:hypothetical protein
VKRVLAGAALLVPLALTVTGGAQATNECKGLDVCISVPGPWVAVPSAPADGASNVLYQVTCPKRSIVGGLDAVLGDPTLEVRWLGLLGSPVNPGISTKRSVFFQATWARGHTTAFRPVVGCVPTSGGGGRSSTAYTAPPPKPLVRRVHTVTVRTGAGPVEADTVCRPQERLVGTTYAVGFHTKLEPPEAILTGVHVALRRSGQRSIATVTRTSAVPPSMRVVLQLQLLCAPGPR